MYITPEGEAKIVHLGVMRPIGDERPEGAVVRRFVVYSVLCV